MASMEVTAQQPRAAELARPADEFLAVIAAAARDPNVDIAKMQALLEMRERLMRQEAEVAFTEAMNRVQNSVPRIVKDRKIVVKGSLRSKYAALEDIDRVLRPLTTAEGFYLSYNTEDVPPKATKLILTVKHRLGHKEAYALVLPLDNSEFRSASQNAASTVSFGRRILRCMAFDIITVDEDVDGNQGVHPISSAQADSIRDLIAEIGDENIDMKAFLKLAEADAINNIQEYRFKDVMQSLHKKRQSVREGR